MVMAEDWISAGKKQDAELTELHAAVRNVYRWADVHRTQSRPVEPSDAVNRIEFRHVAPPPAAPPNDAHNPILDKIEAPAPRQQPELRMALETVLEGFERGVFVRDTSRDDDPSWGARLLEIAPYLRALAALRRAAAPGAGGNDG